MIDPFFLLSHVSSTILFYYRTPFDYLSLATTPTESLHFHHSVFLFSTPYVRFVARLVFAKLYALHYLEIVFSLENNYGHDQILISGKISF